MKALLYDWDGGNVWLFHAINGHPASWMDALMLVATGLGDSWNFPLYLGVWLVTGWLAWHFGYADWSRRALLQAQRFTLGGVLTILLTSALKFGLDYPRPVAVLGPSGVRLLISPEAHHSLPSGHAAFVMLLAGSLWPVLAWPYRLGLILFTAWVGVSRIWLGAHFPADVLAGYAVGLTAAVAAAGIVRKTPLATVAGKNHLSAIAGSTDDGRSS